MLAGINFCSGYPVKLKKTRLPVTHLKLCTYAFTQILKVELQLRYARLCGFENIEYFFMNIYTRIDFACMNEFANSQPN